MDRPRDLVELEDRWLTPYRGMQVIQIRVSYQLTLLLDGGAQVDGETEAELTTRRDVTGAHRSSLCLSRRAERSEGLQGSRLGSTGSSG